MKILELFSGTHSIGKVAKNMGWYIVSLDRDLDDKENISNIHHKECIFNFNYKQYDKNYFNVIWASPVCLWWSCLQNCWIGRKKKNSINVITKEDIQNDIDKYGKPMVDKVREIIEYFQPRYYFIENPATGKMKTYITDIPFYDVDYCKYSNWGYKKKTRIWTNLKNFKPKICKNDCENIIITNKQKLHKERMGTSKTIIDNGVIIRCNTKLLREKYKNYSNIQIKHNKDVSLSVGGGTNRLERYRIPEKLITELFNIIECNYMNDFYEDKCEEILGSKNENIIRCYMSAGCQEWYNYIIYFNEDGEQTEICREDRDGIHNIPEKKAYIATPDDKYEQILILYPLEYENLDDEIKENFLLLHKYI